MGATPQETIAELRDLLVAYAKQETLEPLKGLGKYLAWGFGGAVFLGTGVFFLAMAALRALQTQTGSTFTGNWSFAPYLVVVAMLLALAAASYTIGTRRKAKQQP